MSKVNKDKDKDNKDKDNKDKKVIYLHFSINLI